MKKWIVVGCFALLGTLAIGQQLLTRQERQALAIRQEVISGSQVSAEVARVDLNVVEQKCTQVIREIDLSMLFDTESGVSVRNLDTNKVYRMTEPGIEVQGDNGSGFSYAIEERMDGGQDLMVTMYCEPKSSYLVSYQVIDSETGVKQTTNVTVVNGSITAWSSYLNSDLIASTEYE